MGMLERLSGIAAKLLGKEKRLQSIDGPVFVKEFSWGKEQIQALEQIAAKLEPGEKKEKIYRDIYYLKQGMIGERNVNFELKNSNIPLVCLHDIRLEYEGLKAQIDFLVLTKQYICILETKKLSGNIDLNREGNFIRVYNDKSGKYTRTGMYSPVEQNRRHVNIVKRILKEKFNIDKMPVKSLIVMANPKTVIRKDYAPKEIQEQILKAESLGQTLGKWIEETEYSLKEKQVFELAEYFKEQHKPILYDYEAKYKLLEEGDLLEEEIGQGEEEACILSTEGGKRQIICGKVVTKGPLNNKDKNYDAGHKD